jgi:hypothetical protein
MVGCPTAPASGSSAARSLTPYSTTVPLDADRRRRLLWRACGAEWTANLAARIAPPLPRRRAVGRPPSCSTSPRPGTVPRLRASPGATTWTSSEGSGRWRRSEGAASRLVVGRRRETKALRWARCWVARAQVTVTMAKDQRGGASSSMEPERPQDDRVLLPPATDIPGSPRRSPGAARGSRSGDVGAAFTCGRARTGRRAHYLYAAASPATGFPNSGDARWFTIPRR